MGNRNYKKGGKGRGEKKPYIDPAKLAGLSYEERMKMYKEAYAAGGASSKGDYKKNDYKKKPYDSKKSNYKKGDYKKGDYKKKSYNKGNAPRGTQQAAPEQKKTFWQKVKSFFGR